MATTSRLHVSVTQRSVCVKKLTFLRGNDTFRERVRQESGSRRPYSEKGLRRNLR